MYFQNAIDFSPKKKKKKLRNPHVVRETKIEIIRVLQWIREQAGSENCWGPGKLRRRQEKGGEGVADDASLSSELERRHI